MISREVYQNRQVGILDTRSFELNGPPICYTISNSVADRNLKKEMNYRAKI